MSSHVYNAHQLLQTPPPPSLRDILSAYRTKGDGDREMLLAMLNAKTAEDNRIAQTASLQRTLLELYQSPTPEPQPNPRKRPRESSPPRASHSPYPSYRTRVPLSPYSEEPPSPPTAPISSVRSRSP